MRADNSRHVIAAAQHRAAATRERAVTALRRMDKTGASITFGSVAKQARVSRSWLYSQPDLRAEVELRARRSPSLPGRSVPDR
jgi:spore germination cell wall hydrolase CwlJ-like protein